MRGQWDNEQPLSPSLLRSGLALLFGLLAAMAVAGLLGAAWQLFRGQVFRALATGTTSLAVPFAIWMGAVMLRDLLIVHNRSHDRIGELVALLEARNAGASGSGSGKPRARDAGAAADDGPRYESE